LQIFYLCVAEGHFFANPRKNLSTLNANLKEDATGVELLLYWMNLVGLILII